MNQLPENASSGIAVSPSQQSIVKVQSLEDPEILHSINLFKDILLSCYGPHGQIKIIQNNSGGQVTMTSLSSTLFHCISLSSPVLSLVKAAVQNHLSRFSDGGLLTAILSMSLISKCLESKVPRLICTNVNEYILKQIEDYLQVSECECKVQIDFTSVPTMMKIIRSVIASKPACCLLSNETNLVSSLVLQAYLQTLSMNDVGGSTARLGRVEYVIVDGPPVSDSQLFPGVLFEAPHLPTYRTSINKSKRVEAGLEKGLIKVVLYNTSMSGDSEELMDVRYEVTQDMVASEVVLQKLMQVSEYLVHHGVGLVACQKVIHPAIKKYFKQHNVLAIDRLSLTHIGAVQTLTGAKLLGTLHSAINAADFGYLTDVNHKVLFNKSYIHMESPSAAVVTIVICNRNEQALQELKAVFCNCQDILRSILIHPMALQGGGYTEYCIIRHIKNKIHTSDVSILENLHCSRAQFVAVTDIFIKCLEEILHKLPNYVKHSMNWEESPAIKNGVLDAYDMKLNALQVSVEIANVILHVNNFIHDQN